MSKSCVIFACTILSKDRVHVLHEFIQAFEDGFSDCDFYIGINPDSIPETEAILRRFKARLFMERVIPSLYTFSDAGAYQMALKQLLESGNRYDKYWFVHTKGGVNSHSDYLRKWYIDVLLKRRVYVEHFMNRSTAIGSYGLLGLEWDKDKVYGEQDTEFDLITNSDKLPYTHAHFFYIHTIYVIKSNVIDYFLDNVTDKWFDTKLDRYYFEGVFPFLVSRLGYLPYLSNRISMNGVDLYNNLIAWINENNLVSLQPYIDSYESSFIFNQLNPPYLC